MPPRAPDLIASTDPSYIGIWVLKEKIVTPTHYSVDWRELDFIFSNRESAERTRKILVRSKKKRFEEETLVVAKRDLRFGEGAYDQLF